MPWTPVLEEPVTPSGRLCRETDRNQCPARLAAPSSQLRGPTPRQTGGSAWPVLQAETLEPPAWHPAELAISS